MKAHNSVNKTSRNQRKGGNGGSLTHPPSLASQALQRTVRLRFATNAAAVNQTITFTNLMDTQVVAATTTAGFQMYDMVKIKHVEVWGYSPSGAVTVSVTFDGKGVGLLGNSKLFSDTSIGVSPAHVCARPDKRSQVAQWQASNTNAAFQITCPSSSVVDVYVSLQNNYDGETKNAITQALAGATAGVLYQRGLDGLAFAATKFYPQGITGVI